MEKENKYIICGICGSKIREANESDESFLGYDGCEDDGNWYDRRR